MDNFDIMKLAIGANNIKITDRYIIIFTGHRKTYHYSCHYIDLTQPIQISIYNKSSFDSAAKLTTYGYLHKNKISPIYTHYLHVNETFRTCDIKNIVNFSDKWLVYPDKNRLMLIDIQANTYTFMLLESFDGICSFSPDGKLLVACNTSVTNPAELNTMFIYKVASSGVTFLKKINWKLPSEIRDVLCPSSYFDIKSCDFSNSGKLLILYSKICFIICDWNNDEPIFRFIKTDTFDYLCSYIISYDDAFMLTGYKNMPIREGRNVQTIELCKTSFGEKDMVYTKPINLWGNPCKFSPTHSKLYVSTAGNIPNNSHVNLYRIMDDNTIKKITQNFVNSSTFYCDWSSDGEYVFYLACDPTLAAGGSRTLHHIKFQIPLKLSIPLRIAMLIAIGNRHRKQKKPHLPSELWNWIVDEFLPEVNSL